MKSETKKEMFEAPEVKVTLFDSEDVIRTSPINPGEHMFEI